MKHISILAICIVFCGCASAEPPDHISAPTNAIVEVHAPSGMPITGINVWGGMHVDQQYTLLIHFDCTNGQYMQGTIPYKEVYTANTTNSQLLQQSDYAPKVSNSVLPNAIFIIK